MTSNRARSGIDLLFFSGSTDTCIHTYKLYINITQPHVCISIRNHQLQQIQRNSQEREKKKKNKEARVLKIIQLCSNNELFQAGKLIYSQKRTLFYLFLSVGIEREQ